MGYVTGATGLRRLGALLVTPLVLAACVRAGPPEATRPEPAAPPGGGGAAVPASPEAGEEPLALSGALPEGAVVIAAVGDVNLGGPVGETIERRGPEWPWAAVAGHLRAADVAVVNFEGAASDRGRPEVKAFTFRADPRSVPAMAAAGVDVASVANNHARDFGEAAFADTLAHLRAAGIEPAGGGRDAQEAWRPAVVERKGLRIAFVAATRVGPASWAATPGAPGIARADPEGRLLEAVAGTRRAADAVVVLLHWGVERSGTPTGDQVRLAHALVDAGAAAVVGHHPHVLQPVVRYRGAVIAYSLGNFVFTAPEATQESMILRLGILPDRTVAAAAVPVRVVGGRPQPG